MELRPAACPWRTPIPGIISNVKLQHHYSVVKTLVYFFNVPSQHRRNAYDQELEFWVTIRETGKRTEESSYEHEHSKRQKACHT